MAVKNLVSVTKKLVSGGLHTKFHTSSSSSSEDTSSGSSSDSDSSSSKVASKSIKKAPPASQWDVKRPAGRAGIPTGNRASGRVGGSGLGAGSSADTIGGTANSTRGKAGARGGRGGGRNRRRKKSHSGVGLSGDVVVGGPKDVLTTKSTLYTNKDMSGAVLSVPSAEGEMASSSSTSDNDSEAGKDEVAKSNGHSEQASMEVETVRDYSSCPELQGPPRVGDKLAFKVSQAAIVMLLLLATFT